MTMNTRAVGRIAIACCIGCSGNAGSQPKAAAPARAGLALSIAVASDTVIEVVFTNRGTRPVWFRPSVVVDNIGVKRVGGGSLQLMCRTNPGIRDVPDDQAASYRTPPSDYRLLRHDESERSRIDLKECFDLTRPGDYTLTAHWEDWDSTPPDVPRGAILVNGPLDSLPVELHLK